MRLNAHRVHAVNLLPKSDNTASGMSVICTVHSFCSKITQFMLCVTHPFVPHFYRRWMSIWAVFTIAPTKCRIILTFYPSTFLAIVRLQEVQHLPPVCSTGSETVTLEGAKVIQGEAIEDWVERCAPILRTPAIGINYSDVMMGTMVSQITSLTIVYSNVFSVQIKENIKAQRHWPSCGEFTDDRWIPHTNGQ